MKSLIWDDGEDTHIALSPVEAWEIAQALLQAAYENPSCEFAVRFTDEDGCLKWSVTAKAP